VWLWDQWPNRNTRDLGIDLVAEGFDGTLWAIQCKAYDPESNLKKSDIDSFLSASSQKQFSNRLLITTTKSIGENARNTISDQEKPVQVVDWIRLNDSSVDWSLAEKGLKTKQQTPRNLRPHQDKALSSVIDGFSKSNRGQLIMACGTGKTLTGLRINEAMGNEVTVLLVPSLTLLSQTLKDWLTDRKIDFKWLAVCSDDSVTNDPSDNARLVDYDIPATTDIKVIQKFLEKDGKKVIFSTYQSSDIVKSAILKSKIKVDFVIADEAHRLAGKVGREFASFLDADLPVSKRLFMTATPRVYSNSIKKMSESLDIQILSMDDKEVFGEVLYRYSFSKAISEGILSDYRVVVIGIDDISTKDLFNKRALVKAGVVETDSESLALHVALFKAMKNWNLRRIISFHSRVAKARKFANDQVVLNDWMPKQYAVLGKLNATTISSSMPTSKRRQILDVLKNLNEGETGLVSNARCLTEGIDVPTLDAVVFVDPKTSQVDIIQAIGRAIRLGGSNKTHGTVVVPVHIPKGKSSKDSFDASSFKKIGDVLNALRAHDEDFGEELDKLRTQLGQRGSIGEMPEKLIWDMPLTLGKEFINDIKAITIELSSSNWDFMYGLLLRFNDKNGNVRPAAKELFDGYRLGGWVGKQRASYHSNTLSQDRIEKLNALGPTWSWNPLEDDWNSYYELLVDYVKKSQSSRVSSRGLQKNLGHWIVNQRTKYRNKQLSSQQIKLLESVSGDWTWDPKEQDWDDKFELLKQFEAREGNTLVSAVHIEAGESLGIWVHHQRGYFWGRRDRGKITPYRKKKLESLKSWSWDPSKDNLDFQFKTLQKYVDQYGTSSPPATFQLDGFNLGKWISHLRTDYKKKSLSPEIIKRLESTFSDWSWNPMQDDWEQNFQGFQKFIKLNGHARVPYDAIIDDLKIGIWLANLKSRNKQGRLSGEEIKRIENSHPTWTWTLLDQQWEEFFLLLVDFKNKYGHCNVGTKGTSKTERVLYEWVNTQRKRLKVGKLTEARKVRLEAIGFSFEPIDPWVMSYEMLVAYVAREGDANIPTNYIEDEFTLGRWASTQRGKYRINELTKQQIQLLEKLQGWTWERKTSQ
jgi:superfamily II DNA or RNA helicase